ncbi:hypothetical protein CP157_01165 [Paracoccus marcusii]|uniref:HNH endonuclease signature motif containing protein n=1 Tax=Paracoccus marcusii TaxID=59779 RepID=UPI001C3E7A91|nr:HNH endonuclease signature motif containing protein [Paracoccus marcusii]QXI63447.1 hypothetical protein CP157_01165 [Paracoccus marcusii]
MKVANAPASTPIPLDVILGEEFMLRFWAKVDRSGECWIWQGSKDRQGYGRIKSPGKRVNLKAHRVAYAMVHERDPGEDLVLHGCDNPSCCNPLHLEAGTHSDNMSEMYAHGRRWSRMPLADGYTMTAIRP